MSQPIISEYLERINLQKGEHTKMFGSKKDLYREDTLRKQLLKDYVAEELLKPVELYTNTADNNGLLETMVHKTRESGKTNSMDETERAVQKQILRDFFAYKELAEDLRKLQVITSFDTTKFKNGNEVIQIHALTEMVGKKNRFLNWHKMIQGTLLQPLSETISEFGPGIMSEFDLKYSKSESNRLPFIEKMTQIAEEELNKGTTSEAITYLLEQFDNHLTAHVLHQTPQANKGWTNHMGDRLQSLFIGQNSLAKRIRNIQTSNNDLRLNGFIASLRPVISPYQNNQLYEFTIDNITIREKQLTIEDLDVLASEFYNLKRTDPDLARDIIIYSLIKSGISFSPTSFFEAIPGREVNQLTKDIFKQVKSFINIDRYDQIIETIYENFLDNKWNDQKITNRVWHESVKGWNEQQEFETTEDYGPRVSIVKTYGKDRKTLTFFYKRIEAEERIEENSSDDTTTKYFKYKLQSAKGIRNELIETQEGLSIHNANNEARPTQDLQVTKETVEQVSKGSKTLLARPLNAARLMSGKYMLWSNDAKSKILVRLESVGGFNIKRLKEKKNFSKFGIRKEKDILETIAKRLGYKTVTEMNKSKAMNNFQKNYIKNFYTIEVLTQNNEAQVGEIATSPLQKAVTNTLTEEKQNQIIDSINTNSNLC